MTGAMTGIYCLKNDLTKIWLPIKAYLNSNCFQFPFKAKFCSFHYSNYLINLTY